MALDRTRYLEASKADAGHLIGKDPRSVPVADLKALGFTSPIKALRARCLDCSGGSPSEVRKCPAVTCPAWAFRMGTNLFRGHLTGEASAENSPGESRGFSDGQGKLVEGVE